ncbi:MAG: malto-oligosyltrehalose trehalohydrolase [SAR202 cluster bacterium]|nr:malto-oligosyltrehalose trehalohydrolase [SAR202 cluster bacterium]
MDGYKEGPLGATFQENGRCLFRVWAPFAELVEVHIVGDNERLEAAVRDDWGYHQIELGEVAPGALYFYSLDGGRDLPDPASKSQPQGIHGPSQVIVLDFPWEDSGWRGVRLRDFVIYELHVGAFTHEGTFDAVIPHLDELAELGITAIELMPVAQFPGERNWGYDGVNLFAAQNSYGGPEGLKRLVNACHNRGIAVVLDVVYNHLGPEGNYLPEFGPYFTDRHQSSWGQGLNLDGAHSDAVRRFFINNSLYWTIDCHIDALRLDAAHAILDNSVTHLLRELAEEVHARARALGRTAYLIAESSANDARFMRKPDLGGHGIDAQWNDDFHHSVHSILTGERGGYYIDFGELSNLAKALREGFVQTGGYSHYRKRRHGMPSTEFAAEKFVVFAQNHDQVGNRMLGERLGSLVSFEAQKLAAGLVLLSPYLPMLFMGEEYGEVAPFPYFISHSDPELIEAVRMGRKREFEAFEWAGEPPDPQSCATFNAAKLQHGLRSQGAHGALYGFYKELLRLRREVPALSRPTKSGLVVSSDCKSNTISMTRTSSRGQAVVMFNLSPQKSTAVVPATPGRWSKLIDSADQQWGGPGPVAGGTVFSSRELTVDLTPHSFILLTEAGNSHNA